MPMKEASPVSQEELVTFLLDSRSYSPHPKPVPSLFRPILPAFCSRSFENSCGTTLENTVHSLADPLRSVMRRIQGCDRNQTLLLPNSVDDYIGPRQPGALDPILKKAETAWARKRMREIERRASVPAVEKPLANA
jgi:hypothetical protein